MDTHLEYLSQRRESGRARSGLNIQGKNAPDNATLAKPNSKARTEPEDQPTIFNDEEQGHKRRVQSRRESTPRR